MLASQPMRESALSTVSATEETTMTWPYEKYIIDSVHKHVCGYSSFSDMLLERNGVW